MKLLDIAALQASFAAGDVALITLLAVDNGFEVHWTVQHMAARLADSAGNNGHKFHDPREALLLLKKIGIHSVSVDIAAWQPRDKSGYDDWLTATVEASLEGLRHGTNKIYSAADWARIRATRGWDREVI